MVLDRSKNRFLPIFPPFSWAGGSGGSVATQHRVPSCSSPNGCCRPRLVPLGSPAKKAANCSDSTLAIQRRPQLMDSLVKVPS
eukprot:1222114-Amphidinium_carterae.1